MRREEVKNFLTKYKPPFRIITRKGTIITCVGIIELKEYSIIFRDRFEMTVVQELDDISTLQTFNGKKQVNIK